MSKQRAMDLIRQKMDKNKAIKKKQSRRKGAYGLVKDFIDTVGDIKCQCKTALEFDMELKRESDLLLDRFKQIDPEIELTLRWNRPDKIEKWEDLLIEGVEIKWSRFYLRKHKFEHETKYIDIADLFLKGLLDD